MDLSQQRFFLTGGTGFVGSCLARRLAETGAEVHLLVRAGADRGRLEGIEDQLTFHIGDLTGEELESSRRRASAHG